MIVYEIYRRSEGLFGRRRAWGEVLAKSFPVLVEQQFQVCDLGVSVFSYRWHRLKIRVGMCVGWRDVRRLVRAQAGPCGLSFRLCFSGGWISCGDDGAYVTFVDAGTAPMPRGVTGVRVQEVCEDPWVDSEPAMYPEMSDEQWAALEGVMGESSSVLVVLDWGGPLGGRDWFVLRTRRDLLWVRSQVVAGDLLQWLPSESFAPLWSAKRRFGRFTEEIGDACLFLVPTIRRRSSRTPREYHERWCSPSTGSYWKAAGTLLARLVVLTPEEWHSYRVGGVAVQGCDEGEERAGSAGGAPCEAGGLQAVSDDDRRRERVEVKSASPCEGWQVDIPGLRYEDAELLMQMMVRWPRNAGPTSLDPSLSLIDVVDEWRCGYWIRVAEAASEARLSGSDRYVVDDLIAMHEQCAAELGADVDAQEARPSRYGRH